MVFLNSGFISFRKVVKVMKENTPISNKDVRIKNRNRVLRYLVDADKPITKQDLSLELSMSLPTLNQKLNELREYGLIDASDIADSSGGRKPKLIRLVSNAKLAIGLEITNSEVFAVLLNLKNDIIASEKNDLEFSNTEEYGVKLAEIIECFINKKLVDRNKVLGISIALPGIISDSMKSIEFAPTLNILRPERINFVSALQYHTIIENDANCGGHAENNQIKGTTNMAYLSLGKGVGGTMIINGDTYAGSNHSAAEFGHMCIHPNGKKCSCGRRGCLEAYCSSRCISTDLNMSVEDFFDSVKNNNNLKPILRSYLDNLVIAINNIRIMLDCDVVIGGSLSEYLSHYKDYVEQSVSQPGYLGQYNKIVFAQQHSFSISEGAATMLIAKYIDEI